ncbi:hypothetical protein AN964_15265 [Heyndrickxia shackletonii]|uniref:DUF3397 domain-containing protein n=1 Tax=Heyndrickxia shackletonii TaxID=157838 RepID=A0A0Q3TLZ3_9BACI|nr:DUF3397 domain-containing protein [Heyndrickxia shackletonii]KQL54729.1 hypothetical protein AN964_15265 [Heyndrickxia shackletonii]MBB2478772.1 DUF3397 domain-containing protein [Bacillus sp. APMAM]NEY98383.1 DUF3397 domain-containing protein [Heyndrickxia shackletonii]RTZ57906.1 DUF3397 domain-containing protein [Bacillus sp. SAJ1]
MGVFLSWVAGVLIMIPFIAYLLVFFVVKLITNNHKKAVSFAIDITTFFLILSVNELVLVIWSYSFLWVIVLLLLLIAIGFVFLYRYMRNEIIYSKVFKGFWRFNFLLFFAAYLILMIYGLTRSVLESVAMN